MTEADTRTVEERLAALETALGMRASMTGEQVERFKATFDRCMGDGAFERRQVRLLPPGPVITLTPEHVAQLLSECVTAVKPGETLVVRVPDWWTPNQVDEYQRCWLHPLAADCGIKAMAVCGEELGVVQPEDDAAFAKRVERVWPDLMRWEMERSRRNWPGGAARPA